MNCLEDKESCGKWDLSDISCLFMVHVISDSETSSASLCMMSCTVLCTQFVSQCGARFSTTVWMTALVLSSDGVIASRTKWSLLEVPSFWHQRLALFMFKIKSLDIYCSCLENVVFIISWRKDFIWYIAEHFLHTKQVERYSYLVDLMLAKNHPVLLSGAPGVGKTALINNMVLSRHPSSTVTLSPGVSASLLQRSMLNHILDLQSKAMSLVPGPGQGNVPSNQRHLFFIDDLNMAPTMGSKQSLWTGLLPAIVAWCRIMEWVVD